ncbi:unnamed protein product, partial [Prorocentrum cordatum]
MLGKIRHILHMILVKPAGQRPPLQNSVGKVKRGKADAERQNRSNAEHAVLFEAMNLMIHLEDKCDPQLISMAAGLLGNFTQSTDPNIRYLGLETMARLATNAGTQEHLERYRVTILEKMHESDVSIRRQALNLLYALCRPDNWQSIVDELLQILGQSDSHLKEELVLKIAILAEKNAPNFGWYVDVVFKMLESAPEAVGDDVWFRVVQVSLGNVKEALLHLRRLAQDGGGRTPLEANSEPEAPPPFRFEDRAKIPEELVAGPFEKFSITEDVYSTAYLVARNATEDMYSIWPWKNPQVRIVWFYLFFIVGSQLFVMTVITLCYPTMVDKEVLYVDCANATSVASLVERGAVEDVGAEACREAGKLAFWADLHGKPVAYHVIEVDIPFFDAVLTEGSAIVYMLRFICCSWVFSQMYFQHFESVRSLIAYHDFSRWFIPLKGMEVRNNWAIGIAFVQYGVILVVTTVSFVIVFAQKDPFDIVMNSLAFTFIAEVGSYFNAPLVKRLGATRIEGLPEDYGEINYLYPEYSESNALRDDGTYTDEGWYILEEESKAGLLSDYEVKHNPDAYPRSERLTLAMHRRPASSSPADRGTLARNACGKSLLRSFAVLGHREPESQSLGAGTERGAQVVTGFEDSQTESERNGLKRHAALKAFQSLSMTHPSGPRLHDTLVKLAVYLIGEFGHLLPPSIVPKAKVDVLKQHFGK